MNAKNLKLQKNKTFFVEDDSVIPNPVNKIRFMNHLLLIALMKGGEKK